MIIGPKTQKTGPSMTVIAIPKPVFSGFTGSVKSYAQIYTELIMAVMMQESGGQGNDPMQASECAFNTKYPNTPGSISDPEYSIAVGIQNLAACLSQAGADGPEDIDRVSLALQGYNFGSGYISWALANYGGYSELNALEFSTMMAQRLGWPSYGDPYYVQHVMRYCLKWCSEEIIQ